MLSLNVEDEKLTVFERVLHQVLLYRAACFFWVSRKIIRIYLRHFFNWYFFG